MSYRVLMVCMGNICRSPTAEGVLRHKLALAGLAGQVEVASAGTHATWHRGDPPDARSAKHARQRGYDLSALRAKMLKELDWPAFDLILAMDGDNLDTLTELAQERSAGPWPDMRLLGAFANPVDPPEIPDPYYGGPEGFEQVLTLIERACDGLVLHLRQTVAR